MARDSFRSEHGYYDEEAWGRLKDETDSETARRVRETLGRWAWVQSDRQYYETWAREAAQEQAAQEWQSDPSAEAVGLELAMAEIKETIRQCNKDWDLMDRIDGYLRMRRDR